MATLLLGALLYVLCVVEFVLILAAMENRRDWLNMKAFSAREDERRRQRYARYDAEDKLRGIDAHN